MKKLLILLGLFLALSNPAEGAFSIFTGSYTGDGNDNRSISGIGFQGDWMLVFPDDGEEVTHRNSTNTGDATQFFASTGADFADGIQKFEADGFELGTSIVVNQCGIVYYFTVFKFDNTTSNTGSYTGDNSDNRNLAIVGFDPTYVVIAGEVGGRTKNQRSASNATDDSMFFGPTSHSANHIQDFITNGFQIGSIGAVNKGGETFFNESFLNITNGFTEGTYTGDGNNGRSVSVGFRPLLVIVKQDGGTDAAGRNDAFADGEGKRFDTEGVTANGVQNFETDGFTLGSTNKVNGLGLLYNFMAWKSPPSAVSRNVFLTQYEPDELFQSYRTEGM